MSEPTHAHHAGGPWWLSFLPVVVSFLLGSGVTGISSYFALAQRVSVLEVKHDDIGAQLRELSGDVRNLGSKLDRVLLKDGK